MEINYAMLSRFREIPVLLLAVCLMALSSCGGNSTNTQGQSGEILNKRPEVESATTGEIAIGVDETLRPIGRQIVNAFEAQYPEAKFNVHYLPEPALFTELLNDSVRLIISNRLLTEAESRNIKNQQVEPKVKPLGKTAMVALIHPKNPHDSMRYAQLGEIIQGKLTDWSELGSGQTGPIELVFDDPQSAAARDLQNRFISSGEKMKVRAYAAQKTEEVIEYVSQNPTAIGFVGYPWVSDRDNPKVKRFLEQAKMLRLEAPDSSDIPGAFVRPFQNEVALDRYPLTHKMYALSREHFSGLGTGFVVFAAGEHGQRIILKSGMYPEFPPPRLVVFPED